MIMDESMSEASDESYHTDEGGCFVRISGKNIWNPAHILTRRSAFYSKIDEYYKEGTYTDVNIVYQERIFKCHRLALAAASDYFHNMFRGNFAESHAPDITLRDIDSVTFEQILLYVYRGEIVTVGDDNVYNLLQASEILQLSDIEDHCVHYLTQKNIPKDCALEIYLFARALSKVSLIPAAGEFILQHLDHFSTEEKFLKMSVEDFGTLLTYFQPSSSASQETRLLNAIFRWVCHSTDVEENRRTSFVELAQKVQFKVLSAAHVAQFFDENSADGNDQGCCSELSEAMDLDCSMEIDELSLHVFVATDAEQPIVNPVPKVTCVFSLQENVEEGIDWHCSHSISPAIQKMRIIESDGRLYSLKFRDQQYTFSSSTSIDLLTDVQFLALPSGSQELNPVAPFERRYDRLVPFSLCRFRKNIYLSGLSLDNIRFQCYNAELDAWSPVSIPKKYEPENLVSDETRLYLVDWAEYCDRKTFAAYDPRMGKVEKLTDVGLRCLSGCIEPAVYHKGRIYLPESDMCEERVSTFRMAIYDPAAGRWDVQNLKSQFVKFSHGRRLVSFNNRLWMFALDPFRIYTQTYDSYLQEWDGKYYEKLDRTISNLDRNCTDFTDVVAFKSW